MYAKVLVEYNVKTLDKTFTYLITEDLQKKLKVGMKVKIPFGKVNISGFVLEITDTTSEDSRKLKEIKEIIDENLVLNSELLQMGQYLKEKTLCSLISAYQTMLPSSLKIKNKVRKYDLEISYIYLNQQIDLENYKLENKNRVKQIEIINKLEKQEKILKKELASSSLNTLLKNNIVIEKKEKEYRINIDTKIKKDNELTPAQEKVFMEIKKSFNKEETFLLYGITGSGKTEVYIHLIKEVIKNKQTALLLVPEITLSTQLVKRFYERFGSKVAIFHSALSEGERYDEYQKIIKNEVDVVVGTRSAIFTPLNNLGIIIIDEEHSENYKQENMPRYRTIDMALFRSKYNKIPLVLGSATPSLETMARAKKGLYKLLTLDQRVNSAVLPEIKLVNMQEEMKKRNPIFSTSLITEINETLKREEQVIILLNRRGHSTIVTCQNCGYTYKCPHCDISLTYHKSTNNLRCHYCGYTKFKEKICPECHEEALNYYGLGTEKLEIEIKNIFKDAKVVRMDVDTTTKKGSHERIISDFQNHKYDILLGTQMISKGLDFPNVTLVGVINADLSLNMPDFKARERTFSLLTQTSGRSGRNLKKGKVIIQTFDIDNKIYEFVKNNDYNGFYQYEMLNRHKLDYPPYYYLVSIKVASKEYQEASNEANKIVRYLKKNLKTKTIILGPSVANQFRLNNIYRFQIIIKYKKDDNLFKIIKSLDNLYILNKKVNLEIDMSPNTI